MSVFLGTSKIISIDRFKWYEIVADPKLHLVKFCNLNKEVVTNVG